MPTTNINLTINKTTVGLSNVDNTSDANKPVSTATQSALNLKADITYVDGLVVGLLDDRGSYDASVNTFPAAGGSGTAGAILKGDIWYISVAGTLGGSAVTVGDSVRALVDTPGQTATNWSILETNIGYVPENFANKGAQNGYPSQIDYDIILQDQATGNVLSTLRSLATVTRQWLFPDKSGTVAMLDDMDIMTGSLAVFSPADSTTTYMGVSTPLAPNATATLRQFQLPNGKITGAMIYVDPTSTLGSNEDVTYYLRNITDGTSTLLGTIKYDARGNQLFYSVSISVSSSKIYSVEIVNPAFATNPTNCYTTCKLKWQKA